MPPPTTAVSPAAAAVAAAPARQLAEAFVEDLRSGRVDAAYARMETTYRAEAPIQALKNGLNAMMDYYGTPSAYVYKAQEEGRRRYPDGGEKPQRKVWFATPTPKHAAGVFAYVQVVPEGDHLAVATFSLLSFPEEPPEMLR
ncbi:MAG: hypothetical protein ACRERC_24890 [Candidatus Binatia bacterium]